MYRLEDISIFSKLSEAHLKELYDNTYIKYFTKDSIVFYEGDSSKYLYILLEGSVKLYKTTPKGTQVQINRLDAPAIIGEYACFEQCPYPATCEFITDGCMGMLPFEEVYKYLSNPQFSLEIIKSLTGKVLLLSSLVHKETVLSSEAKVADIIIQKNSIFERLKNNEIASMLNLTPETFSRILTKFKKQGIIKITKHKVTILDAERLYAIVETNTIKDCTNCIANFKKEIGYKE
jgi:CRP/FNR family transcriptional regulator